MGSDDDMTLEAREAEVVTTALAAADAATGGTVGVGVSILNAGRKYLGLTTAAEDLEAGIRSQVEAEIAEAVEGWQRFQAAWATEEAEERPTPADMGALLAEVTRVYRGTTHHNKRRLLRNAIVNAFDPKQYRAGMTRRLLRILDELEYGDVVALRDLQTEIAKDGSRIRFLSQMGADAGSDRFDHAKVLYSQGLLFVTSGSEMLSPGSKVILTSLGERLLRLLRDPDPAPNP